MDSPRVLQRQIEQEMKTSYLDYAMSVLVGRALPDVRDGLKPVHRRILYSMRELGLLHSKPFRKSARIVGDCLGKYHPHGDSSVYDALVRMAQPFSLRYPLVQGQGNFGSVDGDNAAAMRYTEARFAKIAEEMLEDIDKETVAFAPNFDASLQEPLVLPSKFPNLLVNGSSGIAVGMATNIPPHNLNEVTAAVIAQIDNPAISTPELMHSLAGPDFPTGGIILGDAGIRQAYQTGRGAVKVRGRASFEEHKDRERIIITEIPFMVNKSLLIEEIAALVREKRILGISDLRDESDRDGMRVVIELKREANRDVVLNQLFAHSRLETTFGMQLVALVGNQPKTLALKDIITHFIEHRVQVVRARTQFDLTKALERDHILQGLIIALANIDAIIAAIRKAADVQAARQALVASYSLSEKQAVAILDMRLQKLASLEQQKIRDEHEQLLKTIDELKAILGSEQKIRDIIKAELTTLTAQYGDARRTEIVPGGDEDITDEDLIEQEENVVTITHMGYIKRISLSEYRQQRRGGRGITATTTREGDFVERLFVANTHTTILFFTSHGIVHWLKVYQLPEGSRQAKGKALVNLLQLRDGERVTAFVPVRGFDPGKNLVMATKNGTIKKTELAAYSRPRKGGIIAITLEDSDTLINVAMTSGTDQIILASKNGNAVRFAESDIRATGRSAKGVRGMRLKGSDAVVSMLVVDEKKAVLSITEKGFGKRTPLSEYRLTSRGGSGVINIQTTERNGTVVAVLPVEPEDEIMSISRAGIMIRVAAKDISEIGRNTQGSRIMRLHDPDVVVAAALVAESSE